MRRVFSLKIPMLFIALVSILMPRMVMADADEFPEQLIGEQVVAVVNIDLEKVKTQQWKQSIEALWDDDKNKDQYMDYILSLLREWEQAKATRIMILMRGQKTPGKSLSPVICIQCTGTDLTRSKRIFTELGLIPKGAELIQDRVNNWTRIYVKSEGLSVPEGMNLQFKIFRSLLHQSSEAPVRVVFSANFQMRQDNVKKFSPKFPILKDISPIQQIFQYLLADISRNDVFSAELTLGPQPALSGKLHVKNQERAVYVHHDQADYLDRMALQVKTTMPGEVNKIQLFSEAFFYFSDQDQLQFKIHTQALSMLLFLGQFRNEDLKADIPATQPSKLSYVERMKSNDRQIMDGPQKPSKSTGVQKVAIDESLTPEERDQQSAVKMFNLLTVIQVYSNANQNKLPKALSDLGSVVGGSLTGMLINPSTGDSPGYIYVKPDKALKDIKLKSKVPILYESKDGKKVEGGWIGYLNGKVRKSLKEKD